MQSPNDLIYAAKLVEANLTDLLALELGDTLIAGAEAAAGIILGEYYLISFYVYFNGIGVSDIHLLSHFLGNNYSSKLINVSYNSCRFHIIIFPFFLQNHEFSLATSAVLPKCEDGCAGCRDLSRRVMVFLMCIGYFIIIRQ